MNFKRYIQKKVYKLYLKGVDVNSIAVFYDLNPNDVNDIIDYINLIHH